MGGVEEDTRIYRVVVNHEEQYSIWPVERELLPGWNDTGKVGPKDEVLAWIKEVWTDMRPLSLRKKMEEMAEAERRRNGGHVPPPVTDSFQYRAVKRPDGFYILIPSHDQAFTDEMYVSSGWEDTGIKGTDEELESIITRKGGAIVMRYRDAEDRFRYRAFKRPDGLYILLPFDDVMVTGELYVSAGWQDTGITGSEEELDAVIKRSGGHIVQRYRQA
jgi:MbtH protein